MNNSVRVRHFDAPVKLPDACSYTGRSHCPFPASALGIGIFFLRWSSLWGLTNSRKKAEAARLRRASGCAPRRWSPWPPPGNFSSERNPFFGPGRAVSFQQPEVGQYDYKNTVTGSGAARCNYLEHSYRRRRARSSYLEHSYRRQYDYQLPEGKKNNTVTGHVAGVGADLGDCESPSFDVGNRGSPL